MIGFRRVLDRWRDVSVMVRDLPLALLLLAMAFVPSLHSDGTRFGDLPDRPFDTVAVVALVLECLPLAGRRRLPLVSPALVSVGFSVDQLRGYHSLAGTALPIALLSAGAYLEQRRRTTVLAFSAGYVALILGLVWLGAGEGPAEFLMYYAVLALVWRIGTWLRTSRAAEAERRRRLAEDTLLAERSRIARELHDVVTHHVTAMVVQAEAARYLTAAPERLDEALSAVSDTGRQAITDLRHLLDLLNPDHGTEARTPTVGKVLTLVEQARRAGQPVEFTEEGTPAEPAGSAALVAYRVVQESLTNALKYAHGSGTSVRVHHRGREIAVEVTTDGGGSAGASPGGSGRGLAGLRQRVDVLGGDFSAGPHTGGGFVVRARIPAGSPS